MGFEFNVFQIAHLTGVQYVASVMVLFRQLEAPLPAGCVSWDEDQWRAEVDILLPNVCFTSLQSPTFRRIKEVLSFFTTPAWRDEDPHKYQSCIVFILWKLRCHIVHRGAGDTLLVKFADMDLRPHGDELRRGNTCVAWRTSTAGIAGQPDHVYYSFAANKIASETSGNTRLKLEADRDETGIFTRLDPGSTNAALDAMQSLGAYLLTKV